ncbi:hypothetical protein, partial [uncultured Cohaesibacter sp.]|uniref:hypothetical protein n=1 Tax=uncultured Cohaesibacter sp. TaxID=1002546 RepID=UPI0029307EE7
RKPFSVYLWRAERRFKQDAWPSNKPQVCDQARVPIRRLIGTKAVCLQSRRVNRRGAATGGCLYSG